MKARYSQTVRYAAEPCRVKLGLKVKACVSSQTLEVERLDEPPWDGALEYVPKRCVEIPLADGATVAERLVAVVLGLCGGQRHGCSLRNTIAMDNRTPWRLMQSPCDGLKT